MHARAWVQQAKAVECGRFQLVIESVLKSGDRHCLPRCLTCLIDAEEVPFTTKQLQLYLWWIWLGPITLCRTFITRLSPLPHV